MWKQPSCPLTDEWIKKLCVQCIMGYHSAIKRNTFESVLMRWMNLEPIIQSEVSQKDRNKYPILMHVYGNQKDGTDEPICRAANGDADIENRLVDIVGEGKGGMN